MATRRWHEHRGSSRRSRVGILYYEVGLAQSRNAAITNCKYLVHLSSDRLVVRIIDRQTLPVLWALSASDRGFCAKDSLVSQCGDSQRRLADFYVVVTCGSLALQRESPGAIRVTDITNLITTITLKGVHPHFRFVRVCCHCQRDDLGGAPERRSERPYEYATQFQEEPASG